MKTLNSSKEFTVGKHNIGFVSSDFKSVFGDQPFTPNPLGRFQKLGQYMENAAKIEKELKPDKCTLGDLYAFLQDPPEGTKDGYYNLFLIGDHVVSANWDSFDVGWDVNCWDRDEGWDVDSRVFSPGLGSKALGASESSDTLTLPEILEINGVKYKKI